MGLKRGFLIRKLNLKLQQKNWWVTCCWARKYIFYNFMADFEIYG